MNKQMEGDLVTSTKKYSVRQVLMFKLVEEKLMKAGIGFTKELAKSQGAQLIDNIKNIEFKDSLQNQNEKIFGRKLYGKIRDVFSFVLGEHVEEFVSVNYPTSRFSEIQKTAVSLSQKKVAEMELEISDRVEEPHDSEYYTVLGNRAWNSIVREVKAEKALRKEKQAARVRAEKAAKKGEPTATVTATVALAPPLEEEESDEEPLQSITDEDKEVFMDGYMEIYIKERDAFANRRVVLTKIAELRKQSNEEVERYVVVNVIVDNIRSAMVTLTQKIKGCVVNVTKVHNKLTATVCLDATGEFITNPFETSNLSGICQILKNEYHTANLVTFNRDFSDVLSCPVSQNQLVTNPLLASVCTDKRISEWVSVDCWKFMTMDIFFTNILLGYLPGNVYKQKCVAEVFDFLQKMETEEPVEDQEGVGSMRIYQHLVEFMRVQHESESYLSITAPKAQVTTPQKTVPPQQPKTGGGNPYGQRRGPGFETAASAATLYAGEVEHSKAISIRDVNTGNPHRYTATKQKCAVCYGKSTGASNETDHKPRCYGGECIKCKLYGHKEAYCMQDLKKLPK